MATKEVMVVAPTLGTCSPTARLSPDRSAPAGNATAPSTARSPLRWLLLAYLVLGAGDRGGTIGSAAGVSAWDLRPLPIPRRPPLRPPLRLAASADLRLRPDFVSFTAAAPYLLASLRHARLHRLRPVAPDPRSGFVGAWYFLILAPTSSIVGRALPPNARRAPHLPLARHTHRPRHAPRPPLARPPFPLGCAPRRRCPRRRDRAPQHRLRHRPFPVSRHRRQTPHQRLRRYDVAQAYADAGRHAEAVPSSKPR